MNEKKLAFLLFCFLLAGCTFIDVTIVHELTQTPADIASYLKEQSTETPFPNETIVLTPAIPSVPSKTRVQSSPTKTLIPPTATAHPLPPLNTILIENFEHDVLKTSRIEHGSWTIVDDGTGNKVLKGNSLGGTWSHYHLGLPNFSDGVIEYRVALIDYDLQLNNGSGHSQIFFRGGENSSPWLGGRYVFAIMPGGSSAAIHYGDPGPKWEWHLLEGEKSAYYQSFPKGVWYSVRIEVFANRIKVFLNNKNIIVADDSREHQGYITLSIGPDTVAYYDDIKVSIP